MLHKSRKRYTHPCPCGYLGDPQHECSCSPAMLQRYQTRLSGPLLDRIDLHIEVPRVSYKELTDTRADLAGEEQILQAHLAEAIQYRGLDRKVG